MRLLGFDYGYDRELEIGVSVQGFGVGISGLTVPFRQCRCSLLAGFAGLYKGSAGQKGPEPENPKPLTWVKGF